MSDARDEATSDLEAATELLHTAMTLTKTLDMRAVEASPDRVIIDMDWSPDLLTAGGLLHGGAIMALADSSGGLSAFLNLPDGAIGTSTIESKTNFIGGVMEGHTVRATSTPLHVGATTIVIESSLTVDDRLVAKVTQTQTVLQPKS